MSKDELAQLIFAFVAEFRPTDYNPTMDEMIEAEPYRMLYKFANYLKEQK